MENKILSLQKVIHKRAEKKLKAEINEIDILLRKKADLLGDLQVIIPKEGGEDKEVDIKNLFYWTGKEHLHHKIFKNNIDKYVEKETKLFLQEIEDVQNNMYQLQQELEEING